MAVSGGTAAKINNLDRTLQRMLLKKGAYFTSLMHVNVF